MQRSWSWRLHNFEMRKLQTITPVVTRRLFILEKGKGDLACEGCLGFIIPWPRKIVEATTIGRSHKSFTIKTRVVKPASTGSIVLQYFFQLLLLLHVYNPELWKLFRLHRLLSIIRLLVEKHKHQSLIQPSNILLLLFKSLLVPLPHFPKPPLNRPFHMNSSLIPAYQTDKRTIRRIYQAAQSPWQLDGALLTSLSFDPFRPSKNKKT